MRGKNRLLLRTHRFSVNGKLSPDQFDLLCKVALLFLHLQPQHHPHLRPVLQLIQIIFIIHCRRLEGEREGKRERVSE